LSPRIQQKSLQIQQAGLDALRHADYVAADRLLREAMELTPSAYTIYNNLAVNSARQLRLNEASRWLEKARAMAPFDPIVAGNLGVILWLQNRINESYDLLQMAMDRGYAGNMAHYAMGLMALQRQYALEAVRHLSKTNRKSFPYRDLYLSLALQELGKGDAAAKSRRIFLEGHRAPWILAAYRTQ
jgi:Tfp pilus assembly protein PilF